VNKLSKLGSLSLRYAISPYLQEKMLYLGQNEVFTQASETFQSLLQLEISASQISRLCHHYGSLDSINLIVETAHPSQDTDKDSVLYVQADGSNIHTDDGWKEVKLGRIFSEADVKTQKTVNQGVGVRKTIEKSDYLAHKGNNKEFIDKFERLLDERIAQGHKEVVFITDGETWMENWLNQNYSEYPRVLDFYHAVKPLKAFADKTINCTQEREKWIDLQKELLLESQTDIILQNLEKFSKISDAALDTKKSIKTYFYNNSHRMDYKLYRENGWCIGSGAVESAHIVVIQKRMKLCGQRWGYSAQPMLNLRTIHNSKRWNEIINTINLHSFNITA